nr:hypothetical protein [Pandoravirus aubagnensis]
MCGYFLFFLQLFFFILRDEKKEETYVCLAFTCLVFCHVFFFVMYSFLCVCCRVKEFDTRGAPRAQTRNSSGGGSGCKKIHSTQRRESLEELRLSFFPSSSSETPRRVDQRRDSATLVRRRVDAQSESIADRQTIGLPKGKGQASTTL